MWAQATSFTPVSGFSSANRSRMRRRTGISRSAHSMRCLPWRDKLMSFTSYSTDGAELIFADSSMMKMYPALRRLVQLDARARAQGFGLVGLFPGEALFTATKVAVCSRGLINRTAQIE